MRAIMTRKQVFALASAYEALASTVTSKFILFEARIWYYALFLRHGERLHFRGEQHFRYDQNHGNASNQLAWITVILFEMPLTHLLLHLWLDNSWLAWGMDALNLWGLLYFVAEYRATRWRPISLDHTELIIRNGVLAADRHVGYALIAAVSRCEDKVGRQRGVLRFQQAGQLNVCITLHAGSQLPDLMGHQRAVSRIYLSVDQPALLVDALRARLSPCPPNAGTPR